MAKWEGEIFELGDGSVLVECGPMRMFIEASKDGDPRPDMCRQAAHAAMGFLEQVAQDRPCLQRPAANSEQPRAGSLAHVMWQAVRLVGDSDLTPMAAVAGTLADATADFLDERGMTRVVVNNGGDLAIRLKRGERISIGIRPDVRRSEVSHRIVLTEEMRIGGVATSGLGGRSLTRGISSAATTFARDAARADAAATALGNATYVPNAFVTRASAESLDPDTDLKGLDVTISVGELSDEVIERALDQGLLRAEQLVGLDVISGAVIYVKDRMISTAGFAKYIEVLGK